MDNRRDNIIKTIRQPCNCEREISFSTSLCRIESERKGKRGDKERDNINDILVHDEINENNQQHCRRLADNQAASEESTSLDFRGDSDIGRSRCERISRSYSGDAGGRAGGRARGLRNSR